MKKLSQKYLKTLFKKYLIVEWIDPQLHVRESLDKVIKKPYATCKVVGKLIHFSPDTVILEHESVDEEGDYTAIPIPLIKNITTLKPA